LRDEAESVAAFIERHAKAGIPLAGIGHKKYRVGIPDPRVAVLATFTGLLKKTPCVDIARSVEAITTRKSGSLILNVDGILAALFLDMLAEKEKYSQEDLHILISQEFFNALFIIPRTVGFIGHALEQKKNDEGLFRLPEDLLFTDE
jgi:ATP citrate (pro-S)-lyase